MRFRILGPLEVEGPGGEIKLGGRKQRALLALLLVHANELVPAGRLIELIWTDAPPDDAAKALHVQVSRLRRALGPEAPLETRPGGYVMRVGRDEFDVPEFEARAVEGRRLLAEGDASGARAALASALELWRGSPLGDVSSEAFVQPEVARLEELRLVALEDRIDADLALGAHAPLVGELEALVARNPLRERLRGQLMLALYRCGRQAEALQAYRDGRRALVEELGLEPGKPLQELEQRILRHDPRLDLAPAPAATGAELPRPGRRAAGIFVGRERELEELQAALDAAAAGRGRFFLVGGESGIGKTRLADEVASRAKDAEARVLWGRCSKRGGAPAFWPWTTALRELGPDLPGLVETVDEADRFRAFAAVAAALRAASAHQPILLVLDDLHAADGPSLLLLEFVAGELAEMHVAVVGTYVEGADELPELAVLADHSAHHRLRLGPLTAADVERFLALAGAADDDPAAVHAETGGNPRRLWQRVR